MACRQEADEITIRYLKMFSFFGNHPESEGLIEINPVTHTKVDAQNIVDFHSGWMCFQWAYFTQYYLNQIHLNYFKLEWSSWIDIDTKGKPVFTHNWISVSVPSCSASEYDRIHLDPWLDSTVAAFTYEEHLEGNRNRPRSYVGETDLPIGFYKGFLMGVYQNGTYYPVDPPQEFEGEEWPMNDAPGMFSRWPRWVVRKFNRK